jgi:hypothetical protein
MEAARLTANQLEALDPRGECGERGIRFGDGEDYFLTRTRIVW